MAGPVRGEIRQIALSGLATSKWIKLRSAIDSSHAPPSIHLPVGSICSELYLYSCALTAEPCYTLSLLLSVLYHDRRRGFFLFFFPSINSFRIGSEKSVKLLAAKSVEILGETIRNVSRCQDISRDAGIIVIPLVHHALFLFHPKSMDFPLSLTYSSH